MSEKIYTLTPVGRMVSGDAFVGSDKGYQGQPRVNLTTGLPQPQWYVGLAVPKGPECDARWAQMVAKAQADFPQGDSTQPHFKWKVEDGDAGKHAQNENVRGCMIFKLTTSLGAPECYTVNGERIVDPQQLKRGYYIRVNIGIGGNDQPGSVNAGMYLNLGYIQLIGYGEEIRSGPSPAEVFAQPAALPPGASPTPLAGPPLAAPGTVGPPAVPAPGIPAGLAAPGAAVPGVPGALIGGQAPAMTPGAAPYPATPAPIQPAAPVAPAAIPGAVPPAAPGAVPPAPAPAPGLAPGAPMPGTVAGTVAPAPGFLQPGAIDPATGQPYPTPAR